jgi:uncharacterized protein YlxP (DUF503 family)
MIGLLTFHLHLPGCASLKEKRGCVQPLIHRLHRKFNISVAEMGLQDKHQEAVITCGMVGNDSAHLQTALNTIRKWVDANWPEGEIQDTKVEIF